MTDGRVIIKISVGKMATTSSSSSSSTIITTTTSTSNIPVATVGKRPSSCPRYYDLVVEAILSLKDRHGSNRENIAEKVKMTKKSAYKRHLLLRALRTGVANGTILHTKGRFQLSSAEKERLLKCRKSVRATTTDDKNKKKSKRKDVKKRVTTSPSIAFPLAPVNGLDALDQEAKRWGEIYHFY